MSKKTKSAMLALALAGLSAMPVSYAADPVKQDKPASEKKAPCAPEKKNTDNPCGPAKKRASNPCGPANPCGPKKRKNAD